MPAADGDGSGNVLHHDEVAAALAGGVAVAVVAAAGGGRQGDSGQARRGPQAPALPVLGRGLGAISTTVVALDDVSVTVLPVLAAEADNLAPEKLRSGTLKTPYGAPA